MLLILFQILPIFFAWGALVADVAGVLLPVPGGAGITRVVAKSDELADVAKYADDIIDAGKTMSSTADLGKSIHKVYDPIQDMAEKGDKLLDKPLTKYGSRSRPDGVDLRNKIIYELKPNNVQALKRALKQVDKYTKTLGGKWTVVIDMYYLK